MKELGLSRKEIMLSKWKCDDSIIISLKQGGSRYKM